MTNKEWGAVILIPGCQNHCLFCDKIPVASPAALKKQEINVAKNLAELKSEGVRKIDISGNDPIEYGKIVSLIKYISDSGFDYIQLSTHGRNLSDSKFLNQIINSPLNKLRIPLYGSRPETHDAVTQSAGSFSETVRGIRGVLKKASQIEVQTSFLVMKQNRDDIIGFIKLMRKLDITDYYLSAPFVKNDDYSYYIPLKDLGKYVRPALDYARRNSWPIKFMEIPFCVFGQFDEKINNSVSPPNMGEYCQPREKFRTKIKDLPSYRLKKKIPMCKKCECVDFCDGFLVNDIDFYGVKGLKPI